MKKKDQSMAYRLTAARQALQNAAAKKEITQAVKEYNYDEARLQEGAALIDKAEKLYQQHERLKGEKIAATGQLEKALAAAKKPYMKYLQIARLTLKDQPAAAQSLGLKGERKRTIGGWLEDAKQFYLNALSDAVIGGSLAEYGITREKLQAGKALLDQLEQAAADQEKKKGALSQNKEERDRAFEEMGRWMSVFLRVCRFALKGGKEQLLEALGIKVPANPVRKKKVETIPG